MKKLLLAAFCGFSLISANAVYMLSTPKVTSAKVENGQLKIVWDDNNTPNDRITHFHILLHNMHQAKEAETFTLAQSDFDWIESTGTINKHEERGAIWDYLPDCPGWYVKSPLYMDKAMGLDAFQNFAGSDNSDIFGGAYMLSPDYNVYGLKDPTLHISCSLAKEAESVSGGFALYTWSEEWWDEKNYDYKPVDGHDHNYSDISTTGFQDYAEDCTPEVFLDRTRVCFYGNGWSALWINNFKVDVNMQPGDFVRYGGKLVEVEAKSGENSVTIPLNDTETDWTYGIQLRSVMKEFDDSRNITTVRFLSPMTEFLQVGQNAGIENVKGDVAENVIRCESGAIFVDGDPSTLVEIYDTAGRKIMEGAAGQPLAPGSGLFVVKAGNSVAKVAL